MEKDDNTYPAYKWLIENLPNEPEATQAVSAIYSLIKDEDNIAAYGWFLKNYSYAKEARQAVLAIFNMIKEEKNIFGYAWFLDNYSDAPEAAQALKWIHAQAFKMADTIGTIGAYNDFIIAYPIASQMKDATRLVYNLEKDEYTGWFTDEEKESRRLLIQYKIIEQTSENFSYEERIGYMLVLKRMNVLLKTEFDDTNTKFTQMSSNE